MDCITQFGKEADYVEATKDKEAIAI